jgi:hypothetical protein
VSAVIDPTTTVSHLIGLVCFAYVAAALGIGWGLSQTRWARVLLAALAVSTVLLRGAQTLQVTNNSLKEGISDASMRRFVGSVFDPGAHHTAIAPTSLWPSVEVLEGARATGG